MTILLQNTQNLMQVWDGSGSGGCDEAEFSRGMRELGYFDEKARIAALFAELDDWKVGEIGCDTLERRIYSKSLKVV